MYIICLNSKFVRCPGRKTAARELPASHGPLILGGSLLFKHMKSLESIVICLILVGLHTPCGGGDQGVPESGAVPSAVP